VFVILSAAMPSRLLRAFPPGVRVSRVPLEEAILRVRERLGGRPADELSVAQGRCEPVADPH